MRQLLRDRSTGGYLLRVRLASQRAQVLERFLQIAPAHALLLLCDGQDRLRVMTRWPMKKSVFIHCDIATQR